MKLQLVEMTHPKLPGQPARVPVQSVQLHQRAGWQLAEADAPPDPPQDAPRDAPPKDQVTTHEAPADAGASALPDPDTDKAPRARRASKGDE
jgi:hypothetical protein